ncbi:hypothetical protein [Paraburkholderia youngii]|uniref:hypothetical protein n=1 Tax=Paraburkholderia youngii TaxID=2782701 RepID=UPI003D20E282
MATRRPSQRIPGYALFSVPPLGPVGITETEARASGQPLLVGRRSMTCVGRAVEKDEPEDLMKVIVDAETSRILGAAILGTGGDEAIHGLLDLMSAGIPTQPSRTQSRSTRPYRSSSRLCSER